MAEALAVLDRVSRVYRNGDGDVHAVRDVSLSVAPGARIALVGRSGSGKTTLLHILGGLDAPTSGEAHWPGLGPRSQLLPTKVAFVFQAQSLLAPLSAEENVALPLLLAGEGEERSMRAAREVLHALCLGDLGARLPEELSGGQCQRVAAARALVSRPALLLADEPTGQLDHATSGPFVDALLGIVTADTAVVVATHDPALADEMDCRIDIRDGRVA